MRQLNWHHLMVVFLILIIPLQAITSMQNKSLFGDEAYHISSGYSKLKRGDYRLFPEQGPLTPIISAFPLLFIEINFPFNHESWQIKNMDILMPLFIFEYNSDPYRIVLLSRIPMVILSMILAVYVFKWANDLYGRKAAIFALLLYTFSPNMLAHARISSSDFGLTVFVFIAMYHFWRYYKRSSKKNLIIAGIALGLAQLHKFSGIFLFPVFLIIASLIIFKQSQFRLQINILQKKPQLKKLCKHAIFWTKSLVTIFFLSYLIIISAYKFEGMFKPVAVSMREDIHLNKTLFPVEKFTSNKLLSFALEEVPSPLPYYFVRGLGFSFYHAGTSNPTLVVGDHLETKWYFFLLSFLVKTPIPLLIFILLSFALYKKVKGDGVSELFLLVPVVLYHFVFMFTTKQFGYRYIIQTIPFLFVFVSKLINVQFKKNFGKALFLLLILWYIFSSVSIYPHYLSYFNEFIGPDDSYRYFVNTNVDWGQDLFYLKDYLVQENIQKVNLAYYGFPITVRYPLPDIYQIPHEELGCGPTQGIIAISVTELMGKQDCYGWLLNYSPTERIGYSILVYDIGTVTE